MPFHSPRLLHVLNTLRPSGAEVMLRQAAPFWCKAGYDLTILACGPDAGPYAPALAEAGYRIEHLPFQKTLKGMAQLRTVLQRLQPDLLHVHSEGMAFFVALANRSTLNRPALRTVHSNFIFEGLLKQRKRLERALQRTWGVRHVAIGPSVAENERLRFWNPCQLCPNWYDAEYFRPPLPEEVIRAKAQWGLAAGTVALTTVGNCASIKNHRALLEALARPECRDRPWVYLHAGHEEELASERLLAQRLGIAPKVRFLGPVQEVRSLLWAADLFLMPSLYEGFSIAALEAAGIGTPMLLPQVHGLRDLALYDEPSSIAWYPDPGPESLALALAALLESPPPRTERAWTSAFSIHSGAERYLKAYKSLLPVQ